MPQKDRTGPEGKGPMTGRGMGPCKREPTKWQLHLKAFRESNQNMSLKEQMQEASKTYKK